MWKWIAIGCASALLLIVLLIGGGALWFFTNSVPQGVSARIAMPSEVVEGETFDIEVVVINGSGGSITMHEIDIWQSLLEGVFIESTDPVHTDSYSMSVFGGWVSYMYDVEILPGTETVFRFSGKALAPGDYSGTFDMYAGSKVNYLEQYARFLVLPAEDADATRGF